MSPDNPDADSFSSALPGPLQGAFQWAFEHGDRVHSWVTRTPTRPMKIALAVGAVLLLVPSVAGQYTISLFSYVLVFSLLAASLDLIWGYTGMLSFGHAVFFGMGGYLSAYLLRDGMTSLPLILAAAFVLGAVLAVVMIYPALRTETTGVYLAVITLIYSLLFEIAALQFDKYSGGYTGLTVTGWPSIGVPGVATLSLDSTTQLYYVIVPIVFLLAVTLYWIGLSGYGRVLASIRENTQRARAVGYNPDRYKLTAFSLSGGVACIAGALYTPVSALISPQIFAFDLSGRAILYALLGGKGTIFGSFIGTALIYLPETYITGIIPGVWMYVVGLMFIVLVIYLPDGIIPQLNEAFRND